MPPKREATQGGEDLSILDTKKPKPNGSAPKDEDLLYYISIALHPKLKAFPTLLQKACRTQLRQDFYTHHRALGAPHQTYRLLKCHRIRSKCLEISLESLKTNIASLALANTALMEHLLSEQRPGLREDITFSRTTTQKGLENSEFLELNSVRVREVGWGLDDGRALSFYLTKVEGRYLREVAWYVCRGEIKVEEEV